jgi:cation transport regulator ChaB
MAYNSLNDLPNYIRSTLPQNLPKQFKDIYLRAFNNVYSRCKAQTQHENKTKHEEKAHMVAWNIIKTKSLEQGYCFNNII